VSLGVTDLWDAAAATCRQNKAAAAAAAGLKGCLYAAEMQGCAFWSACSQLKINAATALHAGYVTRSCATTKEQLNYAGIIAHRFR
jgi:hypothetical protein